MDRAMGGPETQRPNQSASDTRHNDGGAVGFALPTVTEVLEEECTGEHGGAPPMGPPTTGALHRRRVGSSSSERSAGKLPPGAPRPRSRAGSVESAQPPRTRRSSTGRDVRRSVLESRRSRGMSMSPGSSPASPGGGSSVGSPTSQLLHFFTGLEMPNTVNTDPFDGDVPALPVRRPPQTLSPGDRGASLRSSAGVGGHFPASSPLSPHPEGDRRGSGGRRGAPIPRHRSLDSFRGRGAIPRHGSVDSFRHRGSRPVQYHGGGALDTGASFNNPPPAADASSGGFFSALVSFVSPQQPATQAATVARGSSGLFPPSRRRSREASPANSDKASPRDLSTGSSSSKPQPPPRGLGLGGMFRKTNSSSKTTDHPPPDERRSSHTDLFTVAADPRVPKISASLTADSKRKGNVKRWSSIPTISDSGGPASLPVSYVWQRAPAHARPALAEQRRRELLEEDLESNPVLRAEWMAVLQFRASHTFGTEDVVGISQADVESPAHREATPVSSRHPRVAILAINLTSLSSTASSNPAEPEGSGADGPDQVCDGDEIMWADADTWLWDMTAPLARDLER
eukprot:m.15195 g.15195  ORF g.15195 m.15195 type:complete len:570 (+) comp3238_c0_seq1:246-1955(+)